MLSLTKQPRARFGVSVLLGLLLASATQAQQLKIIDAAFIPSPEEICQLHTEAYKGNHYFRVQEFEAAGKTAAATFDVTYNGFTPEAEAAFQAAVDIWASLLSSSETIHVNASWVGMSPTVLGSAGPNGALALSGFPDGIDRVVGRPLAEALLGTNTNGTSADINANFNSNFADWHFGTGAPSPGQVDFTSVVLHELGHGLNFIRFADVGSGCGGSGLGCMDLDAGAPVLYGVNDVEYIDGSAVSLRDTGTYPDPGTDLGTALTGGFGGVFFNGSVATATHGSAPPLYAPSTFASGSSLSHLDNSFNGTLNALMTPSISYGEVARTPGPVTCALFVDLGWSVALGTCGNLPLPVELIAFDAVADGATLLLTWSTASETNNAGFEIHSKIGSPILENEAWQVLGFVEGHGTTLEQQRYTYRAEALEPGRGDSSVAGRLYAFIGLSQPVQPGNATDPHGCYGATRHGGGV